ncbi:urate hydroxylase PuuD [Marinobacterium arenosum]|uniref:urate hydroxylase PuuD n=1 Tax=Marinobacterium arenosum TaxID=2862496 RepID=UPI001C980137|nr:urate hydroxylase PuuD [Marinobacterium arenosum]MBY4678396.1 urate hydroxylase PuuD [Marinobacterium arenosum]
MDPHVTEWLNLAVRWVHMITGIAWIGASFYFVWLENNLDRRTPREGLSGDLWAIHGGGIYHLEKYKLAPPKMPDNLHWFKWEAYFTWISGVTLLAIVYYLNAELYLIAPGSGIGATTAIGISVAALIAGWFIYDFLCDSALGKQPALLGALIFVLIIAAAWGFSQVFSGRAAYIHVGAIIGTIMVGNVFRIIMPGQRALVKAIEENREPDPVLPAKALLRSRHNNYFTLPVLFIMISNHFPSTYGSEYNWAILAGIAVLSVLVRHYFNTRHETQKYAWTLPAAAVGMIALAFVSAPQSTIAPQAPTAQHGGVSSSVTFETVSTVIAERCTVCHSANPTSSMFTSAPAGVMFDSPEQIRQQAARIQAQSVASEAMPLGNITQMTKAERDLLGLWIQQGAEVR